MNAEIAAISYKKQSKLNAIQSRLLVVRRTRQEFHFLRLKILADQGNQPLWIESNFYNAEEKR